MKILEDRISSILDVNKKTKKIIRSTKDRIIKVLTKQGVGRKFYLLGPATEDCVAMVKKDIQNKECMIRAEYKKQRKTRETIFEIYSFTTKKQVSAFCQQYGEIVEVIRTRK